MPTYRVYRLYDRVFLSGPGGVGKLHIIRLIHSDTVKFLKLSDTFEADDVLTAPTVLLYLTLMA